MTLERVADDELFARPLIVTGVDHRHRVEKALAAEGARARLVLEPSVRDTAPAIAAAAILVGENDLIMVLAADHLIRDLGGFRKTAAAAVPAAEAGHIVVFGISPDKPMTGYGYIRPGQPLKSMAGRRVVRFAEKPDAEAAKSFVAEGDLWNSGMFLMRAGTALDELEIHHPDLLASVRQAVSDGARDGDVVVLDRAALAPCPKISFDHAVMERTDRAVVLDAGFDWSDIGTWSSVWAAGEADADGNVVRGDVTIVDVRRSYLASDRPKIGVVGVEDAIVVATDDAVLVTTMAHADRIGHLADAIEAEPEKVVGDFARHFRPWGSYQALDLGSSHQVKRLVVNAGKRLSLQKHRHRAEHWTVVKGVAEVTVDDRVLQLGPNQSAYIPLGSVHRLANHGAGLVIVIEVQCGDYLGEDDIIRLEDDFGR